MRRSIAAVFFTAIIALCGTFSAAAANKTAAAGTVTTAGGRLNVRSSPGGSIVYSLERGSNVALVSEENGWYRLEYAQDKFGYSSADYISEIESSIYKSVKTSSGRLYVRKTAGGEIINSLASGTRVAVISESDGWSKIVFYGNQTGYVSSKYLTTSQTGTTKYKAISLKVPDFKQTDSRWANHKIGSTKYTIGLIGCTTTAVAMAESYRTGTTVYPHKMEEKLSYSSSGSLYWPSNYQSTTDFNAYLARIYSLLDQGKPVIVGAKKANGSQHWVIVTGCKAADTLNPANFYINDPGTSARTNLGHFFSTYHYLHRIVWYK